MSTTIRLSPEVVEHFKAGGRGCEQWFGGGAAVRRGPDAGNVGKVLRLRVRESGGAGWQVRSVPVRGDGRFMMSRRRRMAAAA